MVQPVNLITERQVYITFKPWRVYQFIFEKVISTIFIVVYITKAHPSQGAPIRYHYKNLKTPSNDAV